jgi:hypothetical protein
MPSLAPALVDAGRRRHYASFFGDEPLPEGFGLVVGNCQAESLRIVLDADDRPTVRVPPVHEITAHETRRLHALLPRAAFLVAQPVRRDYHGLPLGTDQLRAALPRTAAVATFTPVRYPALYPFQATLHIEGVDDVPPLVAYHDVRTLLAASGEPARTELPTALVRSIADDALAELRRREQYATVAVSDLLRPVAAHMRTVNHPGNDVWMPLAARIIEALGRRGEPTDPGRPLLNAVHAPLEPWAVAAWGEVDEPRASWLVEGREVDPAEVAVAHRAWYARHPRFVDGARERLAPLLARWRRS